MSADKSLIAAADEQISEYGSSEWAGELREWTLYLVDILCGEFLGGQGNSSSIKDCCSKIIKRFIRIAGATRTGKETPTVGDTLAWPDEGRCSPVLVEAVADPRILAPVLFLIVCKFQEVQCPLLSDLSVLASVPADVLREAETVLLVLLDFDIYIIDEEDDELDASCVETVQSFFGESATSDAQSFSAARQGAQDFSIPPGCVADSTCAYLPSPTNIADFVTAW